MPYQAPMGMSSPRKVPVTFTFHRKGVHPPLFVAGSFSNPPWEPQEMTASIDQHGDYIFTKEVMVNECSEIQYKFRHASGDWWVLDPDADTATDEHGNINSLLYSPTIKAAQEITRLQEIHIPMPGETAADLKNTSKPEKATVAPNTQDTETGITDLNSIIAGLYRDQLLPLSSTPIEEATSTATEVADSGSQLDEDQKIASTAAEVANSASHLDEGEEVASTAAAEIADSISQLVGDEAIASIAAEVADSASQLDEGEVETDGDDTYPMFSYECFTSPSSLNEPQSESKPQCDAMESAPESIGASNLDFDDPRLEHFPSDRKSIMATMRRVSATMDLDPTVVDKVTLSPIITRRSSVASNPSPMAESFGIDDDADTADEQTEAITPPLMGNMSGHSLQSIAEGEEAPFEVEARDESTPAQYIGPIEKSIPTLMSSDSDERVVMNAASRKPINETNDAETTHDKAQPKPSPTIADEVRENSATPTDEISNSSVSSRSKSSEQINQPDLKDPTNDERPYSPSSAHSIQDKGNNSWIQTLFRTVFVNWIGNLFCWLCRRNHNQVLHFPKVSRIRGALIVVGAGISLWAFRDQLPSMDIPSLGIYS